jgi:hypothetical protein
MYLKTDFRDDIVERIKIKLYQGFSSDVISQLDILYTEYNNGYIPIKFPKSLKKMVTKIIDQLDNRLKIVDKPYANKPYKKYE